MKTNAAILKEVPGTWEMAEVELDEPRQDEIMIKLVGSGLCHSEVHVTDGNYPVGHYPVCGGHEGSGVVVKVGPNTSGWQIDDHAVVSALPACGHCQYCAGGQANLCELSVHLLTGARFHDPTSFRMHLDGRDVAQFCSLGCFSEYTTVSCDQAVKVPRDIPLDKLCLLGCAVDTGWGSAANVARPLPGDTVIIMGVGGVGSMAVQGAAHSGATNVIACDPSEFKRESAQGIGATHIVSNLAEATEIARGLTNGQGAHSVVITVGWLDNEMIADGLAAVRKGGAVVATALGAADAVGVPINMYEFTHSEKRLLGSLYGGVSIFRDIPKFAEMYREGQLKLDEVISKTYTLDEVNEGYQDLLDDKIVRGMITFD